MMFKEYISATAEFLIITQVGMVKNAAIFSRESELPIIGCLSTVCSIDSFFFTMTSMRFIGSWMLPRQTSPMPVNAKANSLAPSAHAVSSSKAKPLSQAMPRGHLVLGLEAGGVTPYWDSASSHRQLLYREHRKATSWITGYICCYYSGHSVCPLKNLSGFCLNEVSILIPCFSTYCSHVWNLRISGLCWFIDDLFICPWSNLVLHLSHQNLSSLILSYYLRAVLVPSQPLTCNLKKPILILISVYSHSIPLLLIIFLYTC